MSITEVLKPVYTSEESAYLIEDYPWGFKLRTKKRVWIDTRENYGQRFMSQTLNPKTGKWCKPKASTYSDIRVIFKDEQGHIHNDGISFYYANTEISEQFLEKYKNGIEDNKLEQLKQHIVKRKERGLV